MSQQEQSRSRSRIVGYSVTTTANDDLHAVVSKPHAQAAAQRLYLSSLANKTSLAQLTSPTFIRTSTAKAGRHRPLTQ